MLLSALKSNMEDIGNRLPEVFSGFRSMSQTTHIAFANVFIPQRCTSIFPQMQNRSSCPHHSPWRSRTYAAVPLQRNMVTCGNPTGTGKRSNRRPRHTSRPPGKDTTGSPPPKPPLRLNLGDSERLQKVMSRLGVASRRNAEDMIAGGKVTVNGNVVREKGVLVNARVDRIAVNGKTVEAPSKAVWIAVHKPPGYLSLPKEGHRRTAASLLPRSQRTSMMPVGSIEEDFSGLLLMTNERGHIPELSKPNNPHVKEWVVDIDGIVSEAQIDPLRRGVKLNGETTNTLPAVSFCFESISRWLATFMLRNIAFRLLWGMQLQLI